jgi:two-component system NarL family response regulator
MPEATIRILIADDHPMIRAGLNASIGPEADLIVVGAAVNGEQALELFREHQPDITLMDLRMPGMGGVAAIRAIRAEFPQAKIIVLSTYQGDEDIFRALEAGAITYLLKDTLAHDLLRVIRDVTQGRRPISPEIAQRLADRMLNPTLTAREHDVIALIARGMRNKEIAAELRISEETAQGHAKNILAKFNVHDRTEAVAVAIRRGIVHVD